MFTCECGDLVCTARIRVAREVYESVRADPRRFLVNPDHYSPATDDLIVRRQEWAVVRKPDSVAHVLEQRDLGLSEARRLAADTHGSLPG